MCACPYTGMPRSPIKARLIINGPLMCPFDAKIRRQSIDPDGVIDAAISQNPGHEARAAVRVLLALARGEPILSEQENIRIDIVMRDNLP